MIRLNVKEYCHNCQDFEPETNVVAYYGNRKKFFDTEVSCKDRCRCENIKDYIEEEIKNDKD